MYLYFMNTTHLRNIFLTTLIEKDKDKCLQVHYKRKVINYLNY